MKRTLLLIVTLFHLLLPQATASEAVCAMVTPLYDVFTEKGEFKEDVTLQSFFKDYAIGASINLFTYGVTSDMAKKYIQRLKDAYTNNTSRFMKRLGDLHLPEGVQKNLDDIVGIGVRVIPFKIGDEIAGIKIERIKHGTNGKYIVIGRNMEKRIIPVSKEINAEHWAGFDSALSEVENLANNRVWIQTKLADGYTVIDIGLDPSYVMQGNMSPGSYYAMELFEVFGIK